MKLKFFLPLALAIVATLPASAQLKILKTGVKGGINYPQSTLSVADITAIIDNQSYDISQIQTDISNGFNAGFVARLSLPLLPVYVHGEALYTQFDQNINMVDGGNEVQLNSTTQRLDFPISAGAKFGPAFVGLGATPSIPLANASDIWNDETQANFTWGWHLHAGVKVWRLLAELKYESGFGFLARDVSYNNYNFSLDARSSQFVVSAGYFFK